MLVTVQESNREFLLEHCPYCKSLRVNFHFKWMKQVGMTDARLVRVKCFSCRTLGPTAKLQDHQSQLAEHQALRKAADLWNTRHV